MARKRIQRRQQHGSASHWKQTDCWYYTEPGTKKRVPLFDENGDRIRGKENKETARLALARIHLSEELNPTSQPTSHEWTVAKVCDVYLDDLHRTANPDWAKQVERWLNDFCAYCGALAVSELKKKHLRTWLQRHTNWNHNTQRNVIASVKAAFNYCCKYDDLDSNPQASYEKPTATPQIFTRRWASRKPAPASNAPAVASRLNTAFDWALQEGRAVGSGRVLHRGETSLCRRFICFVHRCYRTSSPGTVWSCPAARCAAGWPGLPTCSGPFTSWWSNGLYSRM